MKSIACIGQGFVGGSLTTVFSERGFTVYTYDKAGKVAPGGKSLSPLVNSVATLVRECETIKGFTRLYFLCLPTPMLDNGDADLSIVEGVIGELAQIPGERIAIIKSTVPPGTTEALNKGLERINSGLRIVFCPEFLREATALDDMRNQDRIILGGPRPWINKVKHVFQSAFPTVPIVKTSSANAELTKYVINCFLATKISFANEVYQICQALASHNVDIDYDRVIECATMDGRLGKSHWQVPSFESDSEGNPLFGYSLSCFPKDVNALINVAQNVGVDSKVLKAGWQKNIEVRPGRDWEKMFGRAVSYEKKD